MLVPLVLAANTSPVCGLVSETVIDVSVLPLSVTVALAASVIATAALPFHEAVKLVPAAAPFKSTVGAVLMLIVAVTGVLLSATVSVATTVADSVDTPGPPAVLL